MTADPGRGCIGEYLGATADELERTTPRETAGAGVGQRALFRRQGVILLTAEELVLGGWSGSGQALRLRREDILSVENRYTEIYGRFVGGILNSGRPLILSTRTVGQIYLLIDWKEFMETTHDRQWAGEIQAWLAHDSDGRGTDGE